MDVEVPKFQNTPAQKGINGPDIEEEDDDPVVKEFPIFFSNKLAENLNLFQYPVRPSERPYVDAYGEGILDSRIKRDAGILEVDVPIDTTKFYDKTKAAKKWDSVNTQTLSGSISHPEGQMVGVFKDDELHLTPVFSTVQLRPQFKYVDKKSIEDREAVKLAQKDARSKEVKAVQMSAKSTGEQAPKYSGALLSFKQADDEEFVHLDWYDRDSDESWNVADRLISSNKESLDSDTLPLEYISMISCPHLDPSSEIHN
ncbi:hypothetical protein NADFUDRAFT_22565 [Nadsonia fulvescens var. elongata DSM 6958]|uniref:DNA-directed RNA polymerase III subunit Rpc5 n=1 Tax=Nadsonia fulvescens var. elongata DSM 6958 TaxID=857566 RepID=A0A1E3PM26_9ASCO|nr:hypothetical protein NADFUDRAFT_22565 [Nadsonia fulvescens var. elongata DSM 6958]